MHAGEGEAGGRVIELAVRPLRGVVAGLACSRESRRDVVHRADRVSVVVLVA